MKHANLLAQIIILFIAGSCQRNVGGSETADIVFTNGKVYTVNEDQPWAEAVAVKGNKIVFVGSTEEVQAYVGEGTETTDLTGKMMLPGFVSGHDHLIASDWMSYGVQLYSAKNKDEYLQLIKEFADNNPNEKVILGIGWNPAIYGSMPTKEDLDAVVSDRPAILIEFTVHDAWLNSKALELGEINKDIEDPVPGVTFWTRDNQGNPTGTAIEFAWLSTYIKCGAWQPEAMISSSQKKNFQSAVEAGMTTFLNPGVVTPTMANMDDMYTDFEFVMNYLTKLQESGELQLRTLRTFVQPLFKNPADDPETFASRAAEFSKKYDSDNLKSYGIKIHPEGNWSSRTSLMLEPYLPKDDTPVEEIDRPSPTAFGSAAIKADLMKEIVLAANALNLDVITHVDGSATVRGMIDAMVASADAGNTEMRNALHHLFWTSPEDLKRILEYDLTVNITPNFSTDWTGQDLLALDLLGEERTNEQLAVYPAVFRNGNKVSLSADIPSSPPALIGPLFNIEVATTIQDPTNPDSKVFPTPRKGISLELAIKGVTMYPAWQLRMENKIGSIEVGKYADLVVLEENLFDVAPRDIAEVKVLATMMDGKYTYQAE